MKSPRFPVRFKQRWLATALLDLEPRLNALTHHAQLPLLRGALKAELKKLKKSA